MKITQTFLIRILVATLGLANIPAAALSIDGHRETKNSTLAYQSAAWKQQMTNDGLVALYLFDEPNGSSTFSDTSGYGTPLNLIIDAPAGSSNTVAAGGGAIVLKTPTLVRSQTAATKINQACKASNEFTVEAWIRNENNGMLIPENPMRRIVTLSTEEDSSVNYGLSSKHPNFFLSLVYDNTPLYRTVVATSKTEEYGTSIDSDANQVLWSGDDRAEDSLQHVIFSKDKTGVARLYISVYNSSTDKTPVDTLHKEFNNIPELTSGTFSRWDDNAVLGIGNEISYKSTIDPYKKVEDADGTTQEEQNQWLGEMHMLAIYCNALEPEDIMGSRAPGQDMYKSYSVDPNMTVTESMKKAALLYKRLAGVSTSLANPLIETMANDIAQGDLMAAAARVTNPKNDSNFLNITIRDFAARMATREETVNSELDDFITTVIGIARDDASAKDLLTANYTYEADTSKAAIPANKISDILTSNNHYQKLQEGRFDIQKVIKKTDAQYLYDGLGGYSKNIDAAGLLTTRGWMQAHATAGTNRRLVEYSFKQFLCVPLEKWADSDAPDNLVGRDIDRFPAGDHDTYTSTCRACHSVMDPLRGAFAYYDFSNQYVKHTFRVQQTTEAASEAADKVKVWQGTSVVRKMNHNDHVFPEGHVIEDNTFSNNATNATNTAYFGWGDTLSGAGVQDFGKMVADSQAFPFCMAQRAFRSVCKREPASIDKNLLESASEIFKSNGYNLKILFQSIAVSDECTGKDI